MAVAHWLHRCGRTVEIPTTQFAPSANLAEDYVDGGDIFIVERKIIQVKGLGFDFTSRDDWPFGEFIISNKAAVDRMAGRVSAYIMLSKDRNYAGIVDRSSSDHWYVTTKWVRNTGNEEALYACALEHVQFKRIASPNDGDISAAGRA